MSRHPDLLGLLRVFDVFVHPPAEMLQPAPSGEGGDS